jgi:putative transposase
MYKNIVETACGRRVATVSLFIYIYSVPELFNNKYKTTSNRLQGYDYGSEGAYFITINTAKHIIEFGQVEAEKMILNQFGIIAHNIWSIIPDKFRFVSLGEYIIMPNHMHGILNIHQNDGSGRCD